MTKLAKDLIRGDVFQAWFHPPTIWLEFLSSSTKKGNCIVVQYCRFGSDRNNSAEFEMKSDETVEVAP